VELKVKPNPHPAPGLEEEKSTKRKNHAISLAVPGGGSRAYHRRRFKGGEKICVGAENIKK